MERTFVESRALRSVGYDPLHRVLEVEFTHGTVYQYLGVPWATYRRLMRAPSKGRYFTQHIRNTHPFIRVFERPHERPPRGP